MGQAKSHMRLPSRIVAFSVSTVFCLGCAASLPDAARSAFSENFTCPPDRIKVTEVPPQYPPPSPDIASDPERLRMWQEGTVNKVEKTFRWFNVEGCGAKTLYGCNHGGAGNEVDDVGVLQAECAPPPPPPPL